MVRKANKNDVSRIIQLLHQVNMVHHVIRPDLFKPNTTKYDEQELEALLNDENNPIFVYDDGIVIGHAFCQVTEVRNHRLLQDIKTLYIDDICVDQSARGKHVGKALYDFVLHYAKSIGCYNITLNVWEGNDSASRFYKSIGMQVQKTGMEIILVPPAQMSPFRGPNSPFTPPSGGRGAELPLHSPFRGSGGRREARNC